MLILSGESTHSGDGQQSSFAVPIPPQVDSDYRFVFSVQCDDGADGFGNPGQPTIGRAPDQVEVSWPNPVPAVAFAIVWILVRESWS